MEMKKETISQYDFGLPFHQQNDKLIYYAMRHNHNRLHDIIYIASYIHEATFLLSKIFRYKNKVVISLNRIRWELLKSSGQLIDIRSQLVINNISKITFEINNSFDLKRKKIEIRDFCLFENTIFIMTTFNICKIMIKISSKSNVMLMDKEEIDTIQK